MNLSDRFHWTLDFVCLHFNADLGILIPCRFRYGDMTPATHGFSVEVWDTPRFAFMRSLVSSTCNTPIATLTSDARPDHHHDIARSIGLHSLLCAPIRGIAKPHAVICLQRRLTAAPFTPDDLDELETIALIVARELETNI